MNHPSDRLRSALLRLVLICAVGPLADCVGTPPQNPDPAAVSWTTYTNREAGYSVDVPDLYTSPVHSGGPSVLFRHDGYPVLSISLVDEHEGDSRGLWVGHEPVGSIQLAGRDGEKYVYRHYDGPSSMRTVSYVVEHRNRWLGVEFRTELEEADALQRRILESFRFSGELPEEGSRGES